MDIQALAAFLSSVGDKITWLPADETWLRQVANLPERSEDEILDAKEESAERQAAIFSPKPAPKVGDGPGQEEPVEDDTEAEDEQRGDEMSADMVREFYTSTRPNDVQRRRSYRLLQRKVQGVFTKLSKTIKREMRP
jgi:hypothetical protein